MRERAGEQRGEPDDVQRVREVAVVEQQHRAGEETAGDIGCVVRVGSVLALGRARHNEEKHVRAAVRCSRVILH